MNKKYGMSPIGYAIVTVILVGLGMIISAPMLNEKLNTGKTTGDDMVERPSRSYSNDELAELENRLNAKINAISEKSYSDKYICSIEGGLNDDGVVVPINPSNPPAKFVFSCEYKK